MLHGPKEAVAFQSSLDALYWSFVSVAALAVSKAGVAVVPLRSCLEWTDLQQIRHMMVEVHRECLCLDQTQADRLPPLSIPLNAGAAYCSGNSFISLLL